MSNVYTDKYFTKSRIVAEKAGLNPLVKYRVFGRFDGVAALEPVKNLIKTLAPDSKISALPEGTEFKAKDTIMIVEGPFQSLVELETMWLQWTALPCYCAKQSREIVNAAPGKQVLDFAARHLYGPTSVALASYGASVGGIKGFSTDVGANAIYFLKNTIKYYQQNMNYPLTPSMPQGVGTTPHALLALFRGDYLKMAEAYRNAHPNDNFVALIDYNNKEVDDTLKLFNQLGSDLYGVRIDTCGENFAQINESGKGYMEYGIEKGVSASAVESLRIVLDWVGGAGVKIFVSSGFNAEKTKYFMTDGVARCFDGIGTGSFVPKGPQCTADIFEVGGEKECKIGREWGFEANEEFYKKL